MPPATNIGVRPTDASTIEDCMHFQPAPFWRRLLARLLDLVFSMVLAFILVIPVTLIALPFMPLMGPDSWGPIGGITCLALAYVVLESFLLVRRQG